MNISSYCTNLHIDAYPRPCFVKQVNSHIHSLYPTVHSLWGGWLRTLPRWSFWSGVQHWWCHHAQYSSDNQAQLFLLPVTDQPRTCLVSPWRCLPSKLRHFEFLLYPFVSEGHNHFTQSSQEVKGLFLKPCWWWFTAVNLCVVFINPHTAGKIIQLRGWTSGVPGLYGWSNGSRKSICEQTACVNRWCEWKYH